MLGLRTGHVAVVAVVAALYPAFTVALATIVDRERLEVAQRFGLVVAFLAIMMISG
jgi:drug/metabolite transporter (DMT)-like permease